MSTEDSRPDITASATSPWARFEPPLMPERGVLERLLLRCLPGARARHIEFLDRGVVNSNYRIDLEPPPGGPRCVRLRLTRSPEATDREAALARRLAAAYPNLAPVPLGQEACTTPEPHCASLWSWIEGTPLEEADLDEPAQHRLADALAEALQRVHHERLDGFGRLQPDLTVADTPGFGRPAGRWLDDLARRTAVRLDNPAHGLIPAAVADLKRAVARAMAPLWAAAPTGGSLVHGDLAPGNIVVRAGGGLSGLLDWEMARSADPAVDGASAEFELGPRWPVLTARLLERLGADSAEWERRLDLAAVPLLLDARMVARVRHAKPLLDRVDRRLQRLVDRWSG